MTLVTETLARRGADFQVLTHPRVARSMGEAIVLGLGDEVVKTIVLDTPLGHAAAVIPALRRLDMRLVRAAVGDSHVHLATERELHDDYPEFELGAMPPMPDLLKAPVFVDAEVLDHATAVFACCQTESVRVRCDDVFSGDGVSRAYLTVRPEDAWWAGWVLHDSWRRADPG